MPRVSEVFESRFLKAIDLMDEETGEYRRPKVTIEKVDVEDLPGRNGQRQTQPVIYFKDKKKCLPLNKTNATLLQEQLGDEMDDWEGQTIGLYVTTTTFEGAQKQVIRIEPRGKPRAAAPRPAAAAAAAPAPRRAAVREEAPEEVETEPEPERVASTKKFDPDEIPF